MSDLEAAAKERGIKYFLISYTDLFGTQRAKLVPASAINAMCEDGAGFAGFATWLDMSPADPDLFAKPDPSSLIQLPWKPEVGWVAVRPAARTARPVGQSPRDLLRRLRRRAPPRQGLAMKMRRRVRVHADHPGRRAHLSDRRSIAQMPSPATINRRLCCAGST